jgi:hypothetical protein
MVVRDGKLFADHARHGEIPLTPLVKDQFGGGLPFMPQVRFSRDGAGRVNGLTFGGGRIRGIRFAKQP